MGKKLPKIFANKIEKKIDNNNKIYVSSNTETQTIQPEIKENSKTIHQKINEIMKSKKYIYKIPVKIELQDKVITTKIIGKNNSSVITIDNELIKIEEIKNIEMQ